MMVLLLHEAGSSAGAMGGDGVTQDRRDEFGRWRSRRLWALARRARKPRHRKGCRERRSAGGAKGRLEARRGDDAARASDRARRRSRDACSMTAEDRKRRTGPLCRAPAQCAAAGRPSLRPSPPTALPVMRHDGESLAAELGPAFALVETRRHDHVTPAGATQRFQLSLFSPRLTAHGVGPTPLSCDRCSTASRN